jgi:hypothetical protein
MEAVMSVVNQILLLYSYLLSEESKQPWNMSIAEQVDCSLWMDLQRVIIMPLKARYGTPLQSVSPSNYSAAEMKSYYNSQNLPREI